MELRHLDLLRELRDRGTLAAVAEATHRTPSALSQQLRAAERQAGTALVEPDGRRLRLTAAGELLADAAVQVATLLARTDADLTALRTEPAGTVRLAGLPSALEALVPRVVTGLAADGDRVRIELVEADVAEDEYAALARDHDLVVAHSLDAAVPRGADGLFCATLAREPLDIAVPGNHRLARRPAVRALHLVGERWIGVPEGFPFDRIRLGVEAATGQRIDPTLRLRDNRLVAALVAAGHGIAVLPRFTTPPQPGLVTLPLHDVPCRRFLVVLARPDRVERAVVRRVLDLLRGAGATAEDSATREARPGGRG